MDDRIRCAWATHTDQEAHYHDTEWGRPQRDEVTLFEFLVLEGAQAGLSWRTILNKRDGYRAVFDDYDIARIAQYSDADLEARVQDARIVRNRLKVWGVRKNAQAYLCLRDEVGGLAPVVGGWTDMQQVPATTPLSDAISKDMKKRGFTFVGSTIIYAYLQATGVVNDHLAHCWCAAR